MLKDDIINIRKNIKNPREGLPLEVFEFVSTVTPMVNVDLLVVNEKGEILLSWRDDVCGQGWHIPGGIIRFKETLEERLQKTAVRELGTKVEFDRKPVEINEIIMPQDLRGHFISFLYRCYMPKGFIIKNLMDISDNKECISEGRLSWHKSCPDNLLQGQNKVYGKLFSQTYL